MDGDDGSNKHGQEVLEREDKKMTEAKERRAQGIAKLVKQKSEMLTNQSTERGRRSRCMPTKSMQRGRRSRCLQTKSWQRGRRSRCIPRTSTTGPRTTTEERLWKTTEQRLWTAHRPRPAGQDGRTGRAACPRLGRGVAGDAPPKSDPDWSIPTEYDSLITSDELVKTSFELDPVQIVTIDVGNLTNNLANDGVMTNFFCHWRHGNNSPICGVFGTICRPHFF
jgi:hypothetical protein